MDVSAESTGNELRYGDHLLHLKTGRQIRLTQKEADILAVLARHRPHVVTFETLMNGARVSKHDTLGVHILHIRKKLIDTGIYIDNFWGHGWRLTGQLGVDWAVR